MAIERLNQAVIPAGATLPFFDPANGADRRASVTALADTISTILSLTDGFTTQYAAPTATGFSIPIQQPAVGASRFLLLTPTAAFAAGTITLPAQAVCKDRQQVLVFTTQAVTALTVDGNGAVVNGAPATVAANAAFLLRFDGILKAWFCVNNLGAAGFANPMTTLGDLIRGAAAGVPQRLGVGTAGQVLTVVSGEPAWLAAPGGGGLTTEDVQDIVAALCVAGTNMTITYNDPLGTLTFAATGGSSDLTDAFAFSWMGF